MYISLYNVFSHLEVNSHVTVMMGIKPSALFFLRLILLTFLLSGTFALSK